MDLSRLAALFVFFAALLLIASFATRLLGRVGVPSLLFFLLLGVVTRQLPWRLVSVPTPAGAFQIGTLALILILFDGGLSIGLGAARSVLRPAITLAVLGTVLTAAILAGLAWLAGLPLPVAILLGGVVSSTDAAAVFAALRGGNSRLRERVGLTLELESALNDPIAVILTITATEALLGHGHGWSWGGLELLLQVAVGLGMGTVVGFVGGRALQRARLPAAGLYPIMTAALAIGAFGLAILAHGSGLLATVLTAMVLTSGELPYRAGVQRVHDAVAWLAQIAMFFILGLLVRPADLLGHAGRGALLAIGLAIVARPIAVLLSLLPFRFDSRERLFIAATGLRGAVPIVLALYPIIRGVPNAGDLLELVFVMVAFNSLVPGAMVKPLASWLGVRRQQAPPAPAGIEIVSHAEFQGSFMSFHVSMASAVAGATVAELPIPDTCVVALIVRGHEIIPPRGPTRFVPGDHVYLYVPREDRALVELLFGSEEE